MLLKLNNVRANVEIGLSETFGPDVAAAMAQTFVKAVVGRRREIDGASSTRSLVLN
jgi:hypothetical protein